MDGHSLSNKTGFDPYRKPVKTNVTQQDLLAISPLDSGAEFAQGIHSSGPGSPRTKLFREIARQSSKPLDYESDAGKILLERRRGRDLPLQRGYQFSHGRDYRDKSGGPVARTGSGFAYVPPSTSFSHEGNREYYNAAGKEGIANHELEHALNQEAGSYGPQRQREIGPAIGDMVFAAERFQMQEGKPLDHKVQFPGGSPQDIQWMQQQAKKHGYWDGRSMSDLLFNTDAGRVWLRSKMPDPSPMDVGVPDPIGAMPPERLAARIASEVRTSPQGVPQPEMQASPPSMAARVAFGGGQPTIQSLQQANQRAVQLSAPQVSPVTTLGAEAVYGNQAIPAKRRDMQPARRPAQVAQSLSSLPQATPFESNVATRSGGPGSFGGAMGAFQAAPVARNMASPPRPMAAQISDHNQINSDIGAMARQVDGMQARMNQPQHLRFADLGNRAMVNSGMGLQMDGGNLPSSDNQLMFAQRQEQRGQRADARVQSAANPTYHNGIRVNPAAVARNLTMSEADRQNLTDNGWEVTPGGVIQRAPRRQTGGGTFGMPTSPGQQAQGLPQDPPSMVNQANVEAGRERYGLAADGTGSMSRSGRVGAIMARTDLTPGEKSEFIAKAEALGLQKGRVSPDDVGWQARELAQQDQAVRQDRIGRMNTRNQYFDGMRQRQAMEQQQAMMGQIAQSAMMGNPQAMQMMQTIQSGNRDMAQMAMQQARLMQEGGLRQQEIGLLGQRNELMSNQQTQAAQIAADAARRQDAMRESTITHNQNMERMQQEALVARQKADAEMDPIRKRNAEAEAQAAELAVKQADFQFEQQKKEAGYTGDQAYNKKVGTFAEQIGATGVAPEVARMQAKALASEQALTEMANQDPRAASLLDMAPPSDEIASGSPVSKVEDVFARMNQKLNMYPATYGGGYFTSGVPMDGSGGVPANKDMLWHALNRSGVTDTDLRQFLQNGSPANVGMFGSEEDILRNAKEFAAKQNIARYLLGMEIVPFNEQDHLRMTRLTPRS